MKSDCEDSLFFLSLPNNNAIFFKDETSEKMPFPDVGIFKFYCIF